MANGALAQPLSASSTETPFRAWFGCASGCSGNCRSTRLCTTAQKCGSLLDVQHDLDALRSRSAQDWKQLFDDRYRRTTYPYGSGVWGKKKWSARQLIMKILFQPMKAAPTSFGAERLGRQIGLDDLWIKQCGTAHTGSFKDLGHDCAGLDGQADDC